VGGLLVGECGWTIIGRRVWVDYRQESVGGQLVGECGLTIGKQVWVDYW